MINAHTWTTLIDLSQRINSCHLLAKQIENTIDKNFYKKFLHFFPSINHYHKFLSYTFSFKFWSLSTSEMNTSLFHQQKLKHYINLHNSICLAQCSTIFETQKNPQKVGDSFNFKILCLINHSHYNKRAFGLNLQWLLLSPLFYQY